MCRLITLSLVMLSALASAQEQPVQQSAPGDYVLAAGDRIEIRVYGESDLSLQLDVPAAGAVDYAFVGPISLAGKSVRAVQDELHDLLLGDYLVNPRVSVSVARYRDIYVYGAVARPGAYAWEPGLTVRKVISLAGGLKERASGSKWYLVPEGKGEADRQQVSEDDPVGPGDTLTIEESFF